MESLLLYLVLGTAIALMLAGAYGAAPALFVRRSNGDAAGRLFALGAAFPLLEHDLSGNLDGPIPKQAPAEVEDEAMPSLEGDEIEAVEEVTAVAATHDADEVLGDLFAEIGMLRAQIEALRVELADLGVKTSAVAQPRPAAASDDNRRRYRSGPTADLPVSLRRRLSDVRRERHPARSAVGRRT